MRAAFELHVVRLAPDFPFSNCFFESDAVTVLSSPAPTMSNGRSSLEVVDDLREPEPLELLRILAQTFDAALLGRPLGSRDIPPWPR
jgi:hypothetical protein